MWMIGIVSAIAIFALFAEVHRYHVRRQAMNDKDVADLLQRRLDGAVGQSREWAKFVDAPFKDPRLEAIRRRCWEFDSLVTEERKSAMKDLIQELRADGVREP
jgi:hypothetical protein